MDNKSNISNNITSDTEVRNVQIDIKSDTSDLIKTINQMRSFRQELNNIKNDTNGGIVLGGVTKTSKEIDKLANRLNDINRMSGVRNSSNNKSMSNRSSGDASSVLINKLLGKDIDNIKDTIMLLDSVVKSFKAFANNRMTGNGSSVSRGLSGSSGMDIVGAIGGKSGGLGKMSGGLGKVAGKAAIAVAALMAVYKAMDFCIKKGKESYKINQEIENSLKNLGSAANSTAGYLEKVMMLILVIYIKRLSY